MNLGKKKRLAARTFNVGESRVVFLESRLEEIKDAITKQDIRDLEKNGAIVIKSKKGRARKNKKKKKSTGNIKKNIKNNKREYAILTKKLRKQVSHHHKSGIISKEDMKSIRKKIRNREFRSKSHFKENIGGKK